MRRTATVALLLTLTGCAATTTSTTSTTTAPMRTTTTVSQTTNVDALVTLLRSRYPGASRAQIISAAQTACDTLREIGSVRDTIAAMAVDPEVDADEAGDMAYLIGVSIPVYCPEFANEVSGL